MTIYTVTLKANNGLIVTALAGEGSPRLTDGSAKWDVVDRPRRVSMTRFAGKNLFKQDIPLRFDGGESEQSQEFQISTLIRMSQQGSDLSEPPKIKLSGIAHRKDLVWVIDGFDWAQDATWITRGTTPVRIRQDVTVHLTQYVDDNVITTSPSPAVAAQTAKKKVQITTVKGMTLKQIASLEYPGEVDRGMQLILWANKWLDADPRKIIPAGTQLTIPDINNASAGTETFIVP